MTNELYLNKQEFELELDRCIQCKTMPCMKACPVNCCPKEFIAQAKAGDFAKAIDLICQKNPMGEACGLVCPDNFCMKACIKGKIDKPINIPKVQAVIMSHRKECEATSPCVELNGKKIAVIGIGPSGIAAADVLSKKGYEVKIFEAGNDIGGVMNLIPEHRLPKKVIQKDMSFVLNRSNVELCLNSKVEDEKELLNNFDGVIVATGEPNVIDLGVEGDELGVLYTNYLKNSDEYMGLKKVGIVGGGSVAFDCAIVAKKNGADIVEMFVRRDTSDMRISTQEAEELVEYEIKITPMTRVTKVKKSLDKLIVDTIKTQKTENGLVDAPNTEEALPNFDLIIKAIGSRADKKQDLDRVIYAGDCKIGGSTVVQALASGQEAANLLDANINSHKS